MDLDPLTPCQADPKRGAHELSAVIPAESSGSITLFCDRCGCVRRIPAEGSLYVERLDDMTADEITRRMGWSTAEVRE